MLTLDEEGVVPSGLAKKNTLKKKASHSSKTALHFYQTTM
jgi:hypothetical protein